MEVNNSKNKPYYTQRNNALKPNGACNVTSIINALSASGWPVQKLATQKHRQPEDSLMDFILTDERVQKFWKKTDPLGRYPANEWHPVLAYGTNLFLRKNGLLFEGEVALKFGELWNVEDIAEAIYAGGSAVLSGVFAVKNEKTTEHVIGHVVAVVGLKDYGEGVECFVIDDSWGDYRTGYKEHNGNDIPMPLSDFMRMLRPCGSRFKMGHLVKKYGGKI
ncbi:C1 family peptidase [Treponema pectinovorum]|uniref:hypothetical protein n=1 Tax=Treponema pectinovorum TaxID=164 RepID=UPI0011CB247D|nr:hypothetical protein [Treponema pectinovorum]